MPNERPSPETPLADGPLVVLSVVWTEATTNGCRLRIRRPGEESELVPAVGLELNYRRDPNGPRHCIGHHSPRRNDGQYLDCPNRPQPGEKTCVSCAVADAEFAADLHHAHTRSAADVHPAVDAHLQRTNSLYLATFRDGSIKVGTSTARRRDTRWAEQGAWRAVEVATTPDGYSIRRLEDLVTSELGLPQTVNGRRKLKGMASPRPPADLQRLLTERVYQVHNLLTSDQTAQAAEPTLTEEWWSFPQTADDESFWNGLHRYPAKLSTGNHHVQILGTCGRLAALSKPQNHSVGIGNDRFIADLGQLCGLELEVGNFVPEELLVQDSLF